GARRDGRRRCRTGNVRRATQGGEGPGETSRRAPRRPREVRDESSRAAGKILERSRQSLGQLACLRAEYRLNINVLRRLVGHPLRQSTAMMLDEENALFFLNTTARSPNLTAESVGRAPL